MKNRILEFLNNREAILWIKTYNYKEVEKIFLEDIKGLENKRLYVYEKNSSNFNNKEKYGRNIKKRKFRIYKRDC